LLYTAILVLISVGSKIENTIETGLKIKNYTRHFNKKTTTHNTPKFLPYTNNNLYKLGGKNCIIKNKLDEKNLSSIK
jgi:hypothetical protein